MADVRQAFIPAIFFGLNLAIFFAGATKNRVTNAALIGSLSPFLIVPLGAYLFKEHINPRALLFALVAFGGLTVVLFNAPPKGDATARGNVFGVLAMLLWTGYVTSTRHFRRDMDVAVFMATISPIAAVAVLPLAITNRDIFGMSRTGWTYTLILTFVIGVAAHGLMVFAEKTVPIGTIGITQVIQPTRIHLVVPHPQRTAQRQADHRHRHRPQRPAGLPAREPARQPRHRPTRTVELRTQALTSRSVIGSLASTGKQPQR